MEKRPQDATEYKINGTFYHIGDYVQCVGKYNGNTSKFKGQFGTIVNFWHNGYTMVVTIDWDEEKYDLHDGDGWGRPHHCWNSACSCADITLIAGPSEAPVLTEAELDALLD